MATTKLVILSAARRPCGATATRGKDLLLGTMLNITDLECLLERRERIAPRHELLRDPTSESRVGDRLHDAPVVQLLRVIDFGATRNAAGMVVRDVLRIRANRRDDI